MLVPGGNLLAIAFGVIGTQTVEWRRYEGQSTTASGLKVDRWASPIPLAGSLQPVDSRLIQQLGLDWTKNYAKFYATADVADVQRDRTGDKLTFKGRTFQVLDKSDWFFQDGWTGVLCVEVDRAPLIPNQVVQPTRIASTASVLAPIVATGPAVILPALIPSGAIVRAPAISYGQTLAPALIASTALVPNPSVTATAPGAVVIIPSLIASTAAVPSPAVLAGPVAVSPPAIPSTAAVPSPTTYLAGSVVQNYVFGTSTTSAIPFSFDPPATGTAPFTYRIEHRLTGSSGAWTVDAAGQTATTGTVTGLDPDTSYSIRITPLNAAGDGAPTSKSKATAAVAAATITPAVIPSASIVSAPTVTAPAPGAATIVPTIIAPTSSVTAPVVAAGPVSVAPTVIASGAVVRAPTVAPGAVTVSPPAIPSTASVPSPVVAVAGATYDTDAQNAFNAMTVQPNTARKGLYNDLIVGLKADGVWAKLDWLALLAAHDAQAGRLNLRNPAKTLSAVNSPVFTTDRGYQGDGVSAHLDFGEPFAFTGSLFTQNDAHVMVAANDGGAGTGRVPQIGNTGAGRVSINILGVAGNNTYAVNASTPVAYVGSGTAVGIRIVTRQTSTDSTAYTNGAVVSSASSTSSAVSTTNGCLLRSTTTYADDRVCAAGSGPALSAGEVTAYYNRLNTFLTAIGGI